MPNVVFKGEQKKHPLKGKVVSDESWPETAFIFILATAILLLLAFGTFA